MKATTLNRTLEVSIQNNHGHDVIQPANNLAKIFANMLEVQTFSAKQIEYIKGLNYTVLVTNQQTPATI